MKKTIQILALSVLMIIAGVISAQAPLRPCDTYAAMEEVFAKDPGMKANYELRQQDLRTQLENYNTLMTQGKVAAPVFTIPVVFHVLHTGGAENISDAALITAMNQVNSDLAKMGSDVGQIASPFGGLYINSDIKLMLAHKDPNGNCTSGIVHRYDTRTVWDRSGNLNALYSGITWNPTKYLNIIIVKDIVAAVGQTGIVVGYTWLPGTWGAGDIRDAIVYNYGFLSGFDARSLTHELGHWLNLPHTFGNTNNPGITCGDDGIADTPPTKGYFSTCPSSASGNVCSSTTAFYTAGQANVQNIMDYSSCAKNFVGGQTNVMRTTLASATAGRSNLSSALNLGASFTDVNATSPCAPIADFYPSNNSFTVCQGGSLTMRDFSYNGTISSYQWSADNSASIASPNAGTTAISFPVMGTCNVTLTVTNGQGSHFVSKVVTVLDNSPGMIAPILEGFEVGVQPANWSVSNPNNGSVTWQVSSQSAYEGMYSNYIDNFNNSAGQEDALATPIIDLLNHPGTTMTFRYAYARLTSTLVEELAIQASKDCGGTWTNYFTMQAGTLASGSGGVTNSAYFPQPNEWKLYDISLHPNWNNYTTSPNVMFRFKFKSGGGGNYIYIDAINLGIPTGINELTRKANLQLAPNPTNASAQLSFSLDDETSAKLKVYDISGRVVESADQTLQSGAHQFLLNEKGEYQSGIYIVELSLNGARMSKKLVIE